MKTEFLGRWGEEKAAEYLKKQGYRVLGMNYKCRLGEIDVIAENRSYIVFCEVKLRKSDKFAEAREFVTASKQNRLRSTAAIWLGQNSSEKQPRFDVVEIYAPDGINEKNYTVNHIENAFE